MRSPQGADNVVRLATGKPVVVAIDMGYGHLRPAMPLAESFGVPLHHMDRPPLGDARDVRFWDRVRNLYEPLTRASQLPLVGGPARALLDRITAIPPLHPSRDLSAGNSGTQTLVRMAKRGLGETLAPPPETPAGRLGRLAPTGAFRSAHGAPVERALGPLPADEGGASERAALPLLTFAVGGAGAQVGIVRRLLPSLAHAVRAGRWNIALVAGRRPEVAKKLRGFLRAVGPEGHPGATLLEAPDIESYLTQFNALLARTDVLWTKPSEMTFFAALGLPLVLAPPVGVHELANERWAVERGAGLVQNEPQQAAEWLSLWLDDGVLAAAAWAGYCNLPHRGLYRIVDEVARACDGSVAPGPRAPGNE